MGKVRAINGACITPDMVLDNLKDNGQPIKRVYVIAELEDGEIYQAASGDIKAYLPAFSLILQELAISVVREQGLP